MEYTVHQLATLSGVTTRTLRYYDQIGLLTPVRTASNGYRIYGQAQVDRLQQILFYRELDVSLEEIGRLLDAPDYQPETALQSHLLSLLQRKEQLERLIVNVKKTIGTLKGETTMNDNEKFEGFRQKLLDDNESAYGAEIRQKYGDEAVNSSYAKVKGMTEEQWRSACVLREEYEQLLKEAFAQGDPAGEAAQKACDLHRQWLCLFWKEGMYSKEAHRGMGEMYVEDPRFSAYYERIAPGCAVFFRDALRVYCES
jgi:DNA-binding transcriptional MerR regulator